MKRLILGAAGTGIAFGALHSIRERFAQSVYVIAIDPNPRDRVAASLYADAYVQVPLARSPEFGEALRRLAETYPGSCYLPAHDEEIEVAACLAAQGKLPAGLKLVAPPYESVRICRDKWRMYNWLRAHDLPTPETVLATPEAIGAVALPIIVKPRFGTASTGIRLARDRADLVGLDPDRWLLQELLAEPQLSVDAFLGRTDEIFRCVCRLMESPSVGFIEARGNWRVFEDALVARQAERLARRLPLPGAFFFQALSKEPGRWLITDVNPRLAYGSRISAILGADFAAANLADFWGEPTGILLQPIVGEHIVHRQFGHYARPADGAPVMLQA